MGKIFPYYCEVENGNMKFVHFNFGFASNESTDEFMITLSVQSR